MDIQNHAGTSVGQYEYEIGAEFPDGLAFNPAHSSPHYPPGQDGLTSGELLI